MRQAAAAALRNSLSRGRKRGAGAGALAEQAGRPERTGPERDRRPARQWRGDKGRESRRPSPRGGGPGSLAMRPARWSIALLLAALAAAAPAQAQTSVVTVQNTDKSEDSTAPLVVDFAQQFTTGSDPAGYEVISVRTRLDAKTDLTNSPLQNRLKTTIHEDAGGGIPGTEIGELTGVRLIHAGVRWRTVSGSIRLDPNTSYVFVVDVLAQFSNSDLSETSSADEDVPMATGWSIGNGHRERLLSNTDLASFTTVSSRPLRIAIIARVPNDRLPVVEQVRVVSAPTYDADSDGVNDTYVKGDKILVDVEYSEPVKVNGDGNLRLRLDVGTNNFNTGDGSRRVLTLDSVRHGGRTLRYTYQVKGTDSDSDGIWVQSTDSSQILFAPGNAWLGGLYYPASLLRTGIDGALDTKGVPNTNIDGSKTADDIGPRPTGASVNGATLTVTFNKGLSVTDSSALPFHLSVQGAGGVGAGHRNAYQHPSAISVTGDSSEKLELTLGNPARAGDTVTLTYELQNNDGPIEGTDGKTAPAFVNLDVTNNTAGTAAPMPERAAVAGTKLEVFFDEALDETTATAGNAFSVTAMDLSDNIRYIAGTDTASISGSTVTVTLAEAVHPDELARVTYKKPASSPLQNSSSVAVRVVRRLQDRDGARRHTAGGYRRRGHADGLQPGPVQGDRVLRRAAGHELRAGDHGLQHPHRRQQRDRLVGRRPGQRRHADTRPDARRRYERLLRLLGDVELDP